MKKNTAAVPAAASPRYVLTLACDDRKGIVAAVSGFLLKAACNILQSAQFGDESTNRFFLRTEFVFEEPVKLELFRQQFHETVGKPFGMQWQLHAMDKKPRLLLMVSKFGHCLYDLLHRMHSGTLAIEVPAIISNHNDLREIAEWYRVPFYHLPLEGGEAGKPAQEAQVLEVMKRHEIDLVVLARYMQILSPELCRALEGRAINIHHSFLPSFKGARPYHQAFERGVKIIGATAHYVTTDLDEGPIIEQEVTRVDHSFRAEELTAAGRDIESLVLARAVKYHVEHRVLVNGNKTVVFK